MSYLSLIICFLLSVNRAQLQNFQNSEVQFESDMRYPKIRGRPPSISSNYPRILVEQPVTFGNNPMVLEERPDTFEPEQPQSFNSAGRPNIENGDTDETTRIASEFLRYYRSTSPVILLVDNTEDSNRDAAEFIDKVFKISREAKNINFVLMKYNGTGVSTILETTHNNLSRFKMLLTDAKTSSSSVGSEAKTRSATFFALLNAINASESYGEILIFTNRAANDKEFAPLAFKEAINKNVKVSSVWGGKYPTKNEAEILLMELIKATNGLFVINLERNKLDYFIDLYSDQYLDYSPATLLIRKNITGKQSFYFPVDTKTKAVHILIQPTTKYSRLISPKGHPIDLNIESDISFYSPGSFLIHNPDQVTMEVHLETRPTHDVGFWRLDTDNDASAKKYTITILGLSKLDSHTVPNFNSNNQTVSHRNNKNSLKLSITEISEVNKISFIDETGKILSDNVSFVKQDNLPERLSGIEENFSNEEIDIESNKLPQKPFYVLINGKDDRGYEFQRQTYVRGYTDDNIFPLKPLTVEVTASSQLVINSSSFLQYADVYFEVTNNGEKPTFVAFDAKDDKSILYRISPLYKLINPQETTVVRLTLLPGTGSYRDTITFTARSGEDFNKIILVDVGTSQQTDITPPDLDYHFTSDCSDVLVKSCEDGTWTMEVTARDTGSGLLQVSSKPRGLQFPNGYVSGTTDQVTGYISGSCCNPDLQLYASDRRNNLRTRVVNAYFGPLSPGAIAAIALGVLLIIILIIVIIVICIKKCCKKENYNLPVYRGSTKK